jgi:putative NADH-flavin reductase
MFRIAAFALALLLSACGNSNGSVNGQPLSTVGDASPDLANRAKPLSILVFGGTSGIGLQTTKLALERGHTVTSITRRPERMPIDHPRLKNLKGDITDKTTYQDNLSKIDVVISAIGLGPSRKPTTVYSRGMASVLAALQVADSPRVLTITGIGAGDSQGHGGFFYDKILNPLMLQEDYKDKTRQEVLLRSSAVDWTIVRPGFLTDDEATRNYRVLNNLEGVISGEIARADVAHFLLALVEQGTYSRETVFLSN